MEMITITYDNNRQIKVPKYTTYLETSKYSKYSKSALGIKKNNEILSLAEKATTDETIEFFDVNSIEGSKIYKAGLKFIFEVAIKTIFPNAEVSYLHSVPGGMLAEVTNSFLLTISSISQIKKEMAKIIIDNEPFIKLNVLKNEAIAFYNKIGAYEKANNISIYDNIVTMYKLKDYLNYFYVQMPYSTGYVNQFELKYLGNNRLIIIYPSNLTNGRLPEYVHHENIIKTFYEGSLWLKKLNTPYVSELNNMIITSKIKGFIESCELHFTDQLKKACDEIIRSNNHKFIMIAGPSSSGKTTSTRVLGAYLRSKGYDPICISTDDYFVERENNPKDSEGNYDFECLNAIDVDLLNNDLNKLLQGDPIDVPHFNFVTGKKEYTNNIISLKENSIILIEGLHCLNDDLTPYIKEQYKYKIYLSPFIPLNIDRHNYISTLDLRLIRRIVRDNRTRGNDVSTTLKNWPIVRNGEEKYIFPYTHQADIIINTALPYEIGVLKVYVEPLLLGVTTNSPCYEEARRLLKFLRGFYSINSELVSENSILREFIGGNNND